MIQTLRIIRNPNLISPPSSTLKNHPIHSFSTHHHRPKNPPKSPPPPDQSQISAIISSLPPRFTSSHLTSTINLLPNPLLSLPLLHATLRKPNLLLSSSSSFSPFLAAVNLLGKSHLYNQMDSVASLAFSFPSLHLPTKFFNTLIHFYSQAQWIPKAIGVYKIMKSPKSSARPTARTFNLLFAAILSHRGANSYIHHLYMDALRSLFRQMVESDVKPDVHALNAMIKGYVLSLHVNDAFRVFHQMAAVYGVEPDENSYSYLVHGLCAQGRTRNAKEMFAEMRGKGLVMTARAWNSLVCALAMGGEVEEAVGVMWEGVGVSRWPDFVTCRTVVEEMWRRDGAGEAVVLLREMRGKEVIDGRCYKELLNGLREEYCD